MSDTYYSGNNISVTSTMVKLEDVSIPTASISAVSLIESFHALVMVGVFLGLFGLFLFVIGAPIGAVLMVIAAALVFGFWKKGRSTLYVYTSAGAAEKALESRNKALVKQVKSSIEDAIAARG